MHHRPIVFHLVLVLALTLSGAQIQASTTPKGLWRGTVGPSEVAVDVARDKDAWRATMFDLTNDSALVEADQVHVDGATVTLSFSTLQARFVATLGEQGLRGTWSQRGQAIDATLAPSKAIPSIEERRYWTSQGMHPHAPLATSQFAFLVGEWHGKNKQAPNTTLVWKGRWILDGMAVQNTSKTTGDPDTPLAGLTTQWGVDTRIYSASRRAWQHTYTDVLSGDITTLSWTFKKDALVSGVTSWNEGGKPTTNIIKFRDITEDRFTWSLDRSFDGGETWVEDFIVIDNRRQRS